MEKITKEELKNLLGGKALSDEELETVAGGDIPTDCIKKCNDQLMKDNNGENYQECLTQNCVGK